MPVVTELGRGGPGAAPLRFVCPGRRGGQMGGQSTATDLGSVVVLVLEAPELPGATDPPRHGVLWFLRAAPALQTGVTLGSILVNRQLRLVLSVIKNPNLL